MQWASELAQHRTLPEEMQRRANAMLAWYSDMDFPPVMSIDFVYQGHKYSGIVHRVDEEQDEH